MEKVPTVEKMRQLICTKTGVNLLKTAMDIFQKILYLYFLHYGKNETLKYYQLRYFSFWYFPKLKLHWFCSHNFTLTNYVSDEVASLTQWFPLLESAIGTFGMVGLDRLLGLQAQTLLEKIIGLMEANFFKDPAWIELLQNLSNSLNPIENVIAQVFFYLQGLPSGQARSLHCVNF